MDPYKEKQKQWILNFGEILRVKQDGIETDIKYFVKK
jgi:hypothetical protein